MNTRQKHAPVKPFQNFRVTLNFRSTFVFVLKKIIEISLTHFNLWLSRLIQFFIYITSKNLELYQSVFNFNEVHIVFLSELVFLSEWFEFINIICQFHKEIPIHWIKLFQNIGTLLNFRSILISVLWKTKWNILGIRLINKVETKLNVQGRSYLYIFHKFP